MLSLVSSNTNFTAAFLEVSQLKMGRSHRASLIAGIVAAIIFIGAVSSNLIASDLQPILQPYRRWVWLTFAIAMVVAVATEIVEARGRTHSSGSVPPGNTVKANAKRSAAFGGHVNRSTIVSGDKNFIGNKITGDNVGGDKIINVHPASNPVASTLTQPHEIPPPPGDFTGREAELRELLTAIEVGGATIAGFQGMGGIGKTVLAFKLVELLKPRYPDAQFYLDLKGASTQPLTAAEALAHVVRPYHPVTKLPDSESELRGLYLSALDGQHALLLMDNAANAEQVEPLIPPAGCLLLITSRQHFTVPGLAAKNLDGLSASDARDLLLTIAPRIETHADEIAALCGHLPLAIRLAATTMVNYRNLHPAEYVERLRDRQQRFQLIDVSLSLSYELLSEELRERWRLLAVFPGTFADDAAAAVWEVEVDQAKYLLGKLMATSLVEWNETSNRYHLHDLARLFADAKLSAEERAVRQVRFITHYQGVSIASNKLIREGGESRARGLALFDLEWDNIQAVIAWQSDIIRAGEALLAAQAEALDAGAAFDLRQHSRELILRMELSLGLARHLQDRKMEAVALGYLGLTYATLGETNRAIEFYQQRLTIEREIGDRRGEGGALWNMSLALDELGERAQAIHHAEQALTIFEQIEDPNTAKVRAKLAEWREQTST